VLGLAGESGSGKSTVAHAILRLLRPPAVITGGQVLFESRDVLDMGLEELERFRWRRVSIVFQSAMNALNPVMRIGDQVADVLRSHSKSSKAQARERAAELFRLVGIDSGRLDSYPHELSGGMRQRAVIAIALALDPAMVIMDEPTTALDVVVQREILQEINALKAKMGLSILFITHDLSLLVEFATRIAIMYAGEIVETGPAREIFECPLHPYTQGLMCCFPSILGEKMKMSGIPGTPPDMLRVPSGCRFHPRCDRARRECAESSPRYRRLSEGRFAACHLL
jgi:peptide/nickel transport system ATP-binding protein